MRRWPLLCALLVVAVGCGPTEAPTTEGSAPVEEGACGTLAGLKETVKASATRADLAPLGQVLRERLMTTGKWRQLARAGIAVLRENPPIGLSDALDSLRRGEGFAQLLPHMRAVMAYFIGSPKLQLLPDEQFASGEHFGPVHVVTETLRICQPQTTLGLVHGMLSVRIPCETCPSGTRLFSAALLEALAAVVEDPELGGILDTLQFTDDATSETAIGRRAFAVFLDLMVEGIASPSFDLEYFDTNLRVQVNDVLGARLSPSARANLNRFLDVLRLGLSPSVGLLEPLQETLGCMLRLDPGHEIASMLFDYIRLRSLEYRQFVRELPVVFESDDGEVLVNYIARVAKFLAADPQLARDAIGGVLPLMVEGADREMLRALDGLQGKGVASGILEFLARFLGQCAEL